MNENQYTISTAMKYGLAFIFVNSVGMLLLTLLCFGPIFKLSADYFIVYILIFCMIQIIGMIFCLPCPEAVVPQRGLLIGWSVLLLGVFILGILWLMFLLKGGIMSPALAYLWMIPWLFGCLAAGFWLWTLFLLKLTQGIHAQKCEWLAGTILILHSLAMLPIALWIYHEGIVPNFMPTPYMLPSVLLSMINLTIHSLLTACLWRVISQQNTLFIDNQPSP